MFLPTDLAISTLVKKLIFAVESKQSRQRCIKLSAERKNECSALSQTSLSTALLKRDARVGYNEGF